MPRTRSPLPWYQQGRIKKWLSDLFALTSRKKTYTLQIGGSKGLAWVAPQLRRVYVTTELPTTTEGHALLRFDPGNADARMELMLKGFMAHEAGHVRHSHGKPSGKIGRIWNCIEDERIERLMAAEFPELKVAFTFLGDIVNEQHRPKWSYTAMEGVLVWRFEHDRTTPRWQPRKADRDLWYDEILPRLEEGWMAADSHEVERLAREIHTLIKDHQEALNQQPPPPQPQQDMPQETGSEDKPQPEETNTPEKDQASDPDASPSDEKNAEPDENGDEEDQCEAEPSEADDTNASDSTSSETDPDESATPENSETGPEPDEESSSDSTDGDGDPSGEENEASTEQDDPESPDETDGETAQQAGESQPSDSGTESEASSERDGSETANQDDGDDSAGASQSSTDQTEPSSEDPAASEDAGSDDTATTNNTESGEEEEAGTTDENPSGRPQRPHPDDPGPQSNASPEQQAAENADDDEEPDAWDQVDASGTDADELDGTAEEGEGEAADDNQADDDRKTTSEQGGKNAGSERSLPTMPVPDRSTGEIIAKGVEGYARSLAPLLRPLDKPGQRRPHRSKGTYDVRRDLRGDERVFQKKTEPTRSRPLTVKLLIDISISMGGDPIEAARQTAVMLVRAAALCQSKVHIHLFNTEHHPLITEPMPYAEAISLVSQIHVSGGTTLNPALKALTDEAIHPYESELIVVICDGELLPEDYSECKRIADEGRKLGKRYLPVLIGDAATYADEWKAVFGSALPCYEIRDIARTIQGSLTALRSRLG